jgi:hypothetical protein
MKTDQRMARNHLSGSAGDATNAALGAVVPLLPRATCRIRARNTAAYSIEHQSCRVFSR